MSFWKLIESFNVNNIYGGTFRVTKVTLIALNYESFKT